MFFRSPRLSVIVIGYNMPRELPRTLLSLTPGHQGMADEEASYEVLVMDNGSSPPFEHELCRTNRHVRCHRILKAPPSPAYALNLGAKMAKGSILGFIIDGARLLTPGVIRQVMSVFNAFPDPVVAIPGWHLGREPQQIAVQKGYTQEVEDGLLNGIHWPEEGYRLFDIAVPALSCRDGCIAPMAESNALFLRRRSFEELHRFDERFDLPGGGLVNLDFYYRAVTRPNSQLVVLPGEGSFHQLHGGVSTSITQDENERRWLEWEGQYRRLTGHPFQHARKPPILFGEIPPQALPFLAFSANRAQQLSNGAERESAG